MYETVKMYDLDLLVSGEHSIGLFGCSCKSIQLLRFFPEYASISLSDMMKRLYEGLFNSSLATNVPFCQP